MDKKHEQPSYYSIIPANVRYDKELTPNEKLMYGEITALASKKGRAWAQNSYFSELYGVHKKTVSRWISNLENKGYIKVKLEYKHNTKQVSRRYIYINDTPIHNIADRYEQKDGEGIHNNAEEVLSTTSINNTSTNSPAKAERIPYQEIVEYLNEKAGRQFNHSAKGNQKFISARWNEGYKLNDFKQVIDNKVDDWLGDNKMEQYLRPATLFNQKFDQYLNEFKPKKRKTKTDDTVNFNELSELLGE